MKDEFTTSFENLMKNRYGAERRGAKNTSEMMKELLANYYGKAAPVGKRPDGRTVVSFSFDNGETLAQHVQPEQVEEYVVAQSAAEAPHEEYVVSAAEAPHEEYVVSAAPTAPTAPTAEPSAAIAEAASPSADKARAIEEARVDVFHPLQQASAPRARLTTPPSSELEQSRQIATLPSTDETSHAKTTDDDFFADMQAIVSGEKIYDPVKKTVTKIANREPTPTRDQGSAAPSPESTIFDRIALSMQHANAYDLGTIELSNRFSQFDRESDLQQKVMTEKKRKDRLVPAGAPSPAKVNTADFIQDLEAIQKRQASSIAPSGKTSEYSRPFYDTGEHVLTGGDLYADRLRVGQNPGVPFSYGQIIAMADLYESVDQMMGADVGELTHIKSLIERSTAYHRGKQADTSLDVKDDMWDAATRERYLELAEVNYEHFAPDSLFKNAEFAKGAVTHGDHQSAWELHHQRAIQEAQRMFAGQQNNVSLFLEWPLIINAFGDHFLTDAFAAGHIVNKDVTIASFKANFYNGKSLSAQGEAFFKRVAELAFKGDVKKKFSVLETYEPVFLWWNPNIDTENAFRKLLVKAAEQEPDQIANLAVKALHDRLNKDGVEVTNNAGESPWTLTGDNTLNDKNARIIQKAVQQSVDNINDPGIFQSNLDFQPFFARVWKHVPQLTDASQRQVVQFVSDYTRPDSEVLMFAAADLIQRKVGTLIKKLKKQKKLRDA